MRRIRNILAILVIGINLYPCIPDTMKILRTGGGPFGGGSTVTIINGSGSNITLTQGSGLTLYNTADGSTGNRTLAGRGMATIYYMYGGNSAYISGSGLT